MGFFFLFKRANDFVKGARVILFGKIAKISYYIYTTNFFPKIWGRPLPPKAKEWLRPCLPVLHPYTSTQVALNE